MNFAEYKNLVHVPKKDKMQKDKIYCLERNISVRLSWKLIRYFPNIKPNNITFLSYLLLFVAFILNFFSVTPVMAIGQLFILYLITFSDKIDGEIARYKNWHTQTGIYYDYTAHLIYPFVFYSVIGNFYYQITSSLVPFYLSIALGILTVVFVSFRATRLLVVEEKQKKDIMDSTASKEKIKHNHLVRFLDYFTFMIYAWTLYFYITIILISTFSQILSIVLFFIQVLSSLLVMSCRLFWIYPKRKI